MNLPPGTTKGTPRHFLFGSFVIASIRSPWRPSRPRTYEEETSCGSETTFALSDGSLSTIPERHSNASGSVAAV